MVCGGGSFLLDGTASRQIFPPKSGAGSKIVSLYTTASFWRIFFTVESRRKCVIDAITHGDHGKLKNCLDSGASVESLSFKDSRQEGATALYYAVLRRDLKAVDLLLSYGASVNQYPACHTYAPLTALRLKGILPTASDDEIRQKLLNAGAKECR